MAKTPENRHSIGHLIAIGLTLFAKPWQIWFDLKLNIETRFDNNLKSDVSPVQGKRWQHDCLAKVQVVHLTVDSRLLSINAWQNNRHARKCQVNLTSRTEPVSGLEIWISFPMAHLPLSCPWVIRVCVSCQALFDAKNKNEKSLHVGSASKTDKFKTHGSSNIFNHSRWTSTTNE